jgi:hypothetical protein
MALVHPLRNLLPYIYIFLAAPGFFIAKKTEERGGGERESERRAPGEKKRF